MPSMLDWPVWQTIGALWVIVNLRANGTYWVGRGITYGASRTRLVKLVEGRHMAKAQAFMTRWGIFAVPVSFLTIGFQTAVNLSAGVTRMPLIRYIPSVMIGGVPWAILYGTVGLAAFWAAIVAAGQVGWPLVMAAVLLIVGLTVYLRRYRRRHPERFAKVWARVTEHESPAGASRRDGEALAADESRVD